MLEINGTKIWQVWHLCRTSKLTARYVKHMVQISDSKANQTKLRSIQQCLKKHGHGQKTN
jgi:hypothetical protein